MEDLLWLFTKLIPNTLYMVEASTQFYHKVCCVTQGKEPITRALSELTGIPFDMSKFSQSNTMTYFSGSPPGYEGYNEGVQLTQAVRKKLYCVILLDEFDKACKEIPNSLLHVLDEG